MKHRPHMARPVDLGRPDRRMTSPVRCLHCRTIYDMGAVQTIDHHLDCTTWRCPGCRLLVDDRCLSGWGGRRDIERVEQPADYDESWQVDMRGNVYMDRILYPDSDRYYPL